MKKFDTKYLNTQQKAGYQQIKYATRMVTSTHEIECEDDFSRPFPTFGDLVEEIYDEIMTTTYEGYGTSYNRPTKEMRILSTSWLKDHIEIALKDEGYES